MNRIREVIKEQGYTIKSLSDKMGMTRENLSRIISNPSSPTLEKLSEVLNVPVWQFFASKDDVLGQIDNTGLNIVCPRCGEVITVEVVKKKK